MVCEFQNRCRQYFERNYLWALGQKVMHSIKSRVGRIQDSFFQFLKRCPRERKNKGLAIGTSWKFEYLWEEGTSAIGAIFSHLKSQAGFHLDDFVLVSTFIWCVFPLRFLLADMRFVRMHWKSTRIYREVNSLGGYCRNPVRRWWRSKLGCWVFTGEDWEDSQDAYGVESVRLGDTLDIGEKAWKELHTT